jgi:hypothetical protein
MATVDTPPLAAVVAPELGEGFFWRTPFPVGPAAGLGLPAFQKKTLWAKVCLLPRVKLSRVAFSGVKRLRDPIGNDRHRAVRLCHIIRGQVDAEIVLTAHVAVHQEFDRHRRGTARL